MNYFLKLIYIILGGYILLLSKSCIPHVNSYYIPSADKGYLSKHSRLTDSEPLWILEQGGATFYISASKDNIGNMVFKLNIQPVHLDGETSLFAKEREKARALVNPITVNFTNLKTGVLIYLNGSKKIVDNIQIAKGQYGTNSRYIVNYSTNIAFLPIDHYIEISAISTIKASDTYLIEWPSIYVNGELVQLPIIKYEWKSGIQVQFING